MKPVDFPEANRTYTCPPSMSAEECGDLRTREGRTHEHDGFYGITSCFKPSWRDRLRILFGGPVWLFVVGYGMPPVSVTTECPFPRRVVRNDGRPA